MRYPPHPLRRVPPFYLAVALAVFFYLLIGIIFNYTVNWIHPESLEFSRDVMRSGFGLNLHDLYRTFDSDTFEHGTRPRFLNFLFWVLNTKLRANLFRVIPFHPSLSIAWIFAYVLSPPLMARLVFNMTRNPTAAISSTCLYVLSVGFLSGNAQYFHAAKPLTNFVVLLVLYWSSQIDLSIAKKRIYSTADWKRLSKIAVALFLGTLLDETAFFAFLAVPLLFPTLFLPGRQAWRARIVFLLPGVAFCIFVTYLAPVFVDMLKPGWQTNQLSFWQYAFSTNEGFQHVTIKYFLENAFSLLSSHVLPYRWYANWEQPVPARRILAIGVVALSFVFSFFRLSAPEKAACRKLLLTFAVFVVFQSLILTRRYPQRLNGAYYWGMAASIFIAMILGTILSATRPKSLGYLNKALFVSFLFIFTQNFLGINRGIQSWQLRDEKTRALTEQLAMGPEAPLAFSDVYKVWRARNDERATIEALRGCPSNGYWLYHEARTYWRR